MKAAEENRGSESDRDKVPPEKSMERQSSRSGLMARVKSARDMVRSSSARSLMRREPSERRLRKEGSERRSLKKESSSSEKKASSSERKAAKEGNNESRSFRESSQRVGLSASSYHGGRTASSSTSTSRVRRAGPARHKSSDNMELMAGGSSSTRRDDLGAATLHGTSVSRIRSQRVLAKEPGQRGTSKEDRRSTMKRAMSRENVKRPEEYGPGAVAVVATNPVSMYGGSTEVRRGRRRPTKAAEEEPAVVEEEEDEIADNSNQGSEGDDSFAEEEEAPVRRSGSSRKGLAQPRRDLLVLLREQKTVHQTDFDDKENRRILHFLLYQHKLGIDLADLQSSVDHDIAVNGAEAMRRPTLPLYVEPA